MTAVAVVAHSRKTFGGGLDELRAVLATEGFPDPLWYEVDKSRKAPECARRAFTKGADVIFVWGGDGSVQRCIDALAGRGAVIAILPAGTANLLATNLGVPKVLDEAVRIGLHGERRALDTGSVNGERFAVMAGTGLDALMIKDADAGAKARLGRLTYLWTGAKHVNAGRVRATVEVDGRRFFQGKTSCVLFGNVGKLLGGIEAFEGAQPDDGLLELGVITAKNPVQWARTLGRVALGRGETSKFVHVTRGRRFRVRLSRPLPYELDGGARSKTKKLRVKVHPGSITICVPKT